MAAKEAKARIKINKLLEESGWRFLDDAAGKANIVLEPKVRLTRTSVDALGDNFEQAGNGFIDFLLLDDAGFPHVVLEAKSEDKNPLVGKEQARKYARSQNCRFVILSNGNLHYFWDLAQGNPHIVTRFPSPDSIKGYHRFQPNPQRLITEPVGKDYIALTQMPGYAAEAGWNNAGERDAFIQKNRLRFLRGYQKRAVQAIQDAVADGHSRFLFEMATGTGKTLTAAAVIKLFLRTGNARAVFEYFVGYKLGLTATPRDYLKKFDAAASANTASTRDPREAERRLLLDTYRTFGCESGQPTFRYSLLDGVHEGFLINPVVVDARTDITTQLLSDKGYAVANMGESGDKDSEDNFFQRDFEKKFFSQATNRIFCQTFLNNGLRDPISHEFGKSIVFAVSQNHAAKLTQSLNELADAIWPGKYQSDFAAQVTSLIPDAQQYTINFTNNNLLGSTHFLEAYKTSKARVCVTVGMMTTGYDCPDILNLALMRPVFSPSDFVQIKGRGTRKHNFLEQLLDRQLKEQVGTQEKTRFKFFDFFANCEYFEEKFNYDQVLRLPRPGTGEEGPETPPPPPIGEYEQYEHRGDDALKLLAEQAIGPQGMKIDRMFFEGFENVVKADPVLQRQVDNEQWDQAIDHVTTHLLDKPAEFYTLDKLRHAVGVDRRLTLREILEKIFGLIPYFKGKDELLEDEFRKFLLDQPPEALGQHADAIVAMKYFFKAYATDGRLRDIIEKKRLTDLNVNPAFSMPDFKAVPREWRERIPEYVKDYVVLNQFM